MKKFFAVALCALVGCGLYAAEEVFDLVYKADSMELPTTLGFKANGYQNKNANAPQFAGLAPNEDGDTVLLLNNQSKKLEWPTFSFIRNEEFQTLTVDVTYRLADTESADPQFAISVIFKDNVRPKNRLGYANISLKEINSMNGNINFASGTEFQSLRFVFDAKANSMEVYDLKTQKFLGKRWMANAAATSKVNFVSFGDGSSTIHGIVEIMEIKYAFDKKYNLPAVK